MGKGKIGVSGKLMEGGEGRRSAICSLPRPQPVCLSVSHTCTRTRAHPSLPSLSPTSGLLCQAASLTWSLHPPDPCVPGEGASGVQAWNPAGGWGGHAC